ncbi:Fpg/Nei family DNA glycosylase [Peribacillus glennii]|uniref:Formamidopyrimidine-DNA glycosylase n=1 Tax=Peribacillus glennii TaxID=2303991 RepID=A0A372L6W9_9BACI|nr:DNA-formamidopyrimidine glycosylase family protein [Peribacillus glennii]RFU60884.1 Fpg/Nei family DNA glycosylase [Peribacillus glennii]
MAELPELERYRLVLSPHLVSKEITLVEIHRQKSINLPVHEFASRLQGNRITGITRRGKFLIFQLASGENLLLHLMIGGWLFIGNEKINPNRKKQIILSFGEMQLFFLGLRLGYLHILSTEELNKKLGELGPEPLDPAFGFEDFQGRISKKRGILKSVLIDPKFIAGIGSCYSDEICFKAQLKPENKVQQLTGEQIHRLFEAIKPVLENAIHIGGYMDYPLYANDRKTGAYNDHFLVYLRENQPCKRCRNVIQRKDLSSRKSFFCPGCQE